MAPAFCEPTLLPGGIRRCTSACRGQVNATLEEAKWTEAQLEQQLLERHRTEIQETNRRNSDEIEKQLALYRRDLARREEMIQQKDADSQEK